jgi:hypothetical protein
MSWVDKGEDVLDRALLLVGGGEKEVKNRELIYKNKEGI